MSEPDKNSDFSKRNERSRTIQRQPSCVNSEVIQSEMKYIIDLEIIIESIPEFFKVESSVPEGLTAELVFGNIESIYMWHKNEFFKLLQRSIKNPSKFGTKMKEIEEAMLSMYLKYFRNQPVSKYIIEKNEPYLMETSLKSGISFQQIKSNLQLPIGRLCKYRLLFEAIMENEPDFKTELNEAIGVMERTTAALNDFKLLWRLERFPENLEDQGRLICHDPLFCSKKLRRQRFSFSASCVSKRKKFQVFLLEESIIFADITTNGDNPYVLPVYEYNNHIKVCHIEAGEKHSNMIELKFKDRRSNDTIIIYTPDEETNTKWIHAIKEAILQQDKFRSIILSPVTNNTTA